jgi:hypothetical protein
MQIELSKDEMSILVERVTEKLRIEFTTQSITDAIYDYVASGKMKTKEAENLTTRLVQKPDMVNAIKEIESACLKDYDGSKSHFQQIDYLKFYERVKGMMTLAEENFIAKKGGGFGM